MPNFSPIITTMIKLDAETEIKVQAVLFKANQQFNNYETQNSLNTLREGIKLFPDKVENCHLGWSILHFLCEYAYEDAVFDVLDEFLPLYHLCDTTQRGYGTSEFLIAKLAFDRNDLVKAKEYFILANKKSTGRVWQNKKLKPEYRQFFKESTSS